MKVVPAAHHRRVVALVRRVLPRRAVALVRPVHRNSALVNVVHRSLRRVALLQRAPVVNPLNVQPLVNLNLQSQNSQEVLGAKSSWRSRAKCLQICAPAK